jgi:hypothetical protein
MWRAHSANLMPSDYYLWESLKDKAFKINPMWLAHSPNLMPSNYYLWESLKDKAFKINPPTADRLK